MHNFKELKVWKLGIDLTKSIFILTRDFPAEERYGLTSQMTRCAVSIPSNIAEGCGKKFDKELHQFLNIALGSAFELETQLIIAKDFDYINNESFNSNCSLLTEIQKMIYGLQRSLKS